MFRIEPEAPKLTAHVSVAGKDAHELAAGLAEKLSEYARAGVLPEAINVLRGGAPGLDAVAIEATLADVPPKEGTTSTTPTSTPTPAPPRLRKGVGGNGGSVSSLSEKIKIQKSAGPQPRPLQVTAREAAAR